MRGEAMFWDTLNYTLLKKDETGGYQRKPGHKRVNLLLIKEGEIIGLEGLFGSQVTSYVPEYNVSVDSEVVGYEASVRSLSVILSQFLQLRQFFYQMFKLREAQNLEMLKIVNSIRAFQT